MEAGIPPNIAILVSAVKTAGFDVRVFSTNDYKYATKTGDEVREMTLQVPPADPKEVLYKARESDMVLDFQKMVDSYRPDIIGFSTTEATYKSVLKLLRAISGRNIFTIVGGAHPTLCPEEVIAEEGIDAICVGEGDIALVELCRSLYTDKIDYKIQNLWFKVNSRIVKNPIRPLADIDDTPFQNWSAWDVPPRASKLMAGKVRKTALVELTRGCPFRCSYCANNFLNQNFKNNYRERSIDKFIEEVKYLWDKYGIEFVYIADETILTTSAKRFNEFIDKYSVIKLPFWCETRPEFIEYEKVKSLKEVGLQAFNIGVESGNYEFRKKILNRSVPDGKIIRGIREAVRAGTRVGANVIIGFPQETRSHIFETIELVRQAQPTSTMVHLFQPYRKTPLREVCIEMGLIKESHICGDYRIDAIGTGALSATELLGLQKTFNLYIDFPKNRWSEIREAESFDTKGRAKFVKLAKEYQLKHFGRTSF